MNASVCLCEKVRLSTFGTSGMGTEIWIPESGDGWVRSVPLKSDIRFDWTRMKYVFFLVCYLNAVNLF